MKLVSSNLSIEVKSYGQSTSAYQKQIFRSTSNDHNSSYIMIWGRYYISMETYESPLSNEIGFIKFGYRSKTLWLIYFRLSKQSTKGRIREFFLFLGAFCHPPSPKIHRNPILKPIRSIICYNSSNSLKNKTLSSYIQLQKPPKFTINSANLFKIPSS